MAEKEIKENIKDKKLQEDKKENPKTKTEKNASEKQEKDTVKNKENKNEVKTDNKIKDNTNKQNTDMKQEDIKKQEETKIKKSKFRRNIVLVVLALALLVVYVIERGEYLEIKEIGENYTSIFWQNLKYICVTGAINFLVAFGLVYKTTTRIKKGLKTFFDDEKKVMPKLPQKSIAFIVATLVTIFSSNYILQKALMCFNSTQFVVPDPVFGYDVGYFVFIWPFIELIVMYALVAVVAMTVYAALYYVLVFNIFFDGISRESVKKSLILNQALNNLKALILIFAMLVLVETQNIGVQKFITLNTDDIENYALFGAGTTEINIRLWAYIVLAIVIVFSAFRAIGQFKKGNTRKVVRSILIVPGYLVIVAVVMLGYNLIFVNSNELDKEKQYIADNIKYTKMAYGVDIEETSIEDGGTITSDAILANSDTINNIPITNEDLVLKDLNGSLTSKGYYAYRNTKIALYQIDGKNQLVFATPREISNGSGTYNNKTYEYTHGFGLILTSATNTTSTGNLNHIQKSFEQSDEKVEIKEPRIYFGLETNNTVVTNSNSKKEFDYPILDAADNTETVYSGTAGLEANFLDRLVLAIKERDAKLVFSGNVKSDSKILTNRNIIQRAKTIMPYLTYDEEPYMVATNDGELVWVLDAYTTSNNYPYSQRTMLQDNGITKDEINYIRNSVKVIINAYSGDVTFYITDKTDPIAMVYKNIYPDLFSEEEIPEDISNHFVYPKYLYKIQAGILERYHNVQPDVLYRNDDVWDVATHNTSKVATKKGTAIEPYYTMVKTVDSESRLGLVLPYTPYDKQNITAYLVGSCDENGNNVLKLYNYTTDSNILGPMQLDTQIEQDETISSEINSLNVSGTKIIKDMIIVPIDNCLLYVEPIYQQYVNETNSLPTLKKVVVASGSKVAIGNNFTEALNNLVSKYAVEIEVENTDSIEELVQAIIKANTNLKESTQINDWEMIGKDTKKLQELINKLQEVKEEEDKKNKDKNNVTNNVLVNEVVGNYVTD